MEDQFYDNDFERFLQQQVKHHRMYPSDAVWKGIYKQMHGYKRWPGLYFFAILMIASLTVCTLFIESEPINYPPQLTIAKATTLQYDQLNPAEITAHTIRKVISNSTNDASVDLALNTETDIPVEEARSPLTDDATQRAITPFFAVNASPLELDNTSISVPATSLPVTAVFTSDKPAAVNKLSAPLNASSGATAEEAVPGKTTNPTDEFLEQHPEELSTILQQQVRNRPSRWQLQFYIAPSMNYRVIVDEQAGGSPNGGPSANNYGVNASKVIRYNPGMGIEFGLGGVYNLTNKLKIKAALQYNIRQYNIEAYAGSTELAKIALIRGSSVDTFLAISRYRSTGLYGEAQLLNKYHQVSLPVGLEYTLFASRRFGFNIY